MPPGVTKYCLQEVTDYSDFESLCHDLMALEEYPKIEPLGGFSDKGRDAVHIDNSGKSTIFAYSVREDWRAKLAEDAAKIKRHNHTCDEMVFLCTADFSANERDEAVRSILEDYGWTLHLFGLERLRVLLDSKHPHIKQSHPAIFPPALLKGIENASREEAQDHLLIISAQADRIFAAWLARKLTADGYAVWYKTIKYLGDDHYPQDINKAIKTQTFRVIVVYSKSFFESTDEIGLRALALDVGKDLEIDFVIPLSVDPQDGGIAPDQFAVAVPVVPNSRVGERFSGPPDGQFKIRREDGHPDGINLDVLIFQIHQDLMNFGGSPKAVPSGRGQQNHQPHLTLILIELGFEIADVRGKLVPTTELVNGQGSEPEHRRRHDADLDINAFHTIYPSNNRHFPPLSAGTVPSHTNKKRNNRRGAA